MTAPPRKELCWTDLGRMTFREAWTLQKALVSEHKAGRGKDRILLVEHPSVLTLGRRAERRHILAEEDELAAREIEVVEVERGGDVTWHGPGQQVVYPILDLRGYRKDVRWYSGALAEAAVQTLAEFDIEAEAREGRETGVWAAIEPSPGAPPKADQPPSWGKIAALGLRIERWIAYHGIALNVDPDLTHFDLIVPCGLDAVRSISMSQILGRPLGLDTVRPALIESFGQVLDRQMVESDAEDLRAVLRSASKPA